MMANGRPPSQTRSISFGRPLAAILLASSAKTSSQASGPVISVSFGFGIRSDGWYMVLHLLLVGCVNRMSDVTGTLLTGSAALPGLPSQIGFRVFSQGYPLSHKAQIGGGLIPTAL